MDKWPPKPILDEIAKKVDQQKMEDKLMEEGLAKFADPRMNSPHVQVRIRKLFASVGLFTWVSDWDRP